MPKSDNSVNTRAVVLDILIDVNENKKYSHNVINKAFSKYKNLNKQDRAFKTGSRYFGKTAKYRLYNLFIQ